MTEAIALIALPTIFSNVWQASVGGQFWAILRRQWPLIVPLMIVLYLTVWLIGQKGPNWAFLVLAGVLIVYSALGLLRIRLHIHADLERLLAPVIGTVSGFVAGLVGVPIIPLMPYLQGLDIKPSELVQTLGVVLCATSLHPCRVVAGVRPPRWPARHRVGRRRGAGAGRHVGGPADPPAAVGRAVSPGRALGPAADGRLYFRQPRVVIS